MFRRILVAVNDRASGSGALVAALQLARDSGGRVRLMHAADEAGRALGTAYGVDLTRLARDRAGHILREAVDFAQAAGIPCEQQLVDSPGRALADLLSEDASSWEADVVVVDSHADAAPGAGNRRAMEEVLRSVPVPVLVVRQDCERRCPTRTPATDARLATPRARQEPP